MGSSKEFLSESGSLSCMRLMSMLSLSIAGFIAIYAVCTRGNINDTIPLVAVFVTAAFGGKVWQKAYEGSNKKVKYEQGKAQRARN